MESASSGRSGASGLRAKTAASTSEKKRTQGKNGKSASDLDSQVLSLCLYIAGSTPRSLLALKNLRKICDENLAGRYELEVIDLSRNPQLAVEDQIIAIPTLVRKLPKPPKRIIGDLADTERVLIGLDLRGGGHLREK